MAWKGKVTVDSKQTTSPSTPRRQYKLALCDVDGTLRHKDIWYPDSLAMLAELHTAGVHVALCSGRTPGSLTTIVRDIPDVEFVASSSGATVLQRVAEGWQVLAHRAVPLEAAELALDIAKQEGIELWAFTDREWYVPSVSERVNYEIRYVDDAPLVGDLHEHADRFGKLLFLLDDETQLAVIRERGQLPGTEIVVSGRNYVDLITAEAHDAKGGDVIVDTLGVGWDQVIAMGDSENDRGMLTRAGLAICIPPIRVADLGAPSPGQLRFDAADTAHARRIVGEYLGN